MILRVEWSAGRETSFPEGVVLPRRGDTVAVTVGEASVPASVRKARRVSSRKVELELHVHDRLLTRREVVDLPGLTL